MEPGVDQSVMKGVVRGLVRGLGGSWYRDRQAPRQGVRTVCGISLVEAY